MGHNCQRNTAFHLISVGRPSSSTQLTDRWRRPTGWWWSPTCSHSDHRPTW